MESVDFECSACVSIVLGHFFGVENRPYHENQACLELEGLFFGKCVRHFPLKELC
jgi:hypothetical protein